MKRYLSRCLLAGLIALLFSLTGCTSNQTLETPSGFLFLDGTLQWDTVVNADHYILQIDNQTPIRKESNSHFLGEIDSIFTVKVAAVKESSTGFFGLNETEEIQSSFGERTFRPLARITTISIDQNGIVSWPSIENSIGYIVKVNGINQEIQSSRTYQATGHGNYTIRILPVAPDDSEYYTYWSDERTYTVLQSTSQITYDGEYISWLGVIGASDYQVYVNGIMLQGIIGNRLRYDANSENFEVQIKTIGDSNITFNSTLSNPQSFLFFGSVTNINVTDGILSWDPILGATGYQIKINGVIQQTTLTEPRYTNLVANQSYAIELKPITASSVYFSHWSDSRFVTILGTPLLQWDQNIQLDGERNSAIFWDGVSNAVGYTIRIIRPNGQSEIAELGQEARNFAYDFLDQGEYHVAIKANAQPNSNFYDSVFSSKPIIVQRLSAPSPASNNHIVSNPEDLSEGFTVTFNSVAGAAGYQLYKDGILLPGESTSNTTQFHVANLISSEVGAAQQYVYSIQSIGRVYTTSGQTIVVLNSLSAQNLSFQITILPMPLNIQMDGFNITWNSIGNSANYTINYAGENHASSLLYRDLSVLATGVFDVSVAARGNGSNVLPSNFSPAIQVHRIAPPTNIRISTQDQTEGILTWDSVNFASSYNAIIDEVQMQSIVNNQTNMSQYISNTGTTFHIVSIANYYKDQNASTRTYYMTSIPSETLSVSKLNPPTFGQFSLVDNSKLVWNAPSNLNLGSANVTYNIYNNTGLLVASGLNVPTFDLSTLASGRSYTFTVKAIGDGVSMINSGLSDPFTFQKLTTPTVVRSTSEYTWSSIPGATGYAIYIDGVLSDRQIHVSGSTYSMMPVFDQVKTYQIRVIAIGNGVDSVNSSPFEFTQVTLQLPSPDFVLSYSESAVSVTGKIQVLITTESLNNNGYTYIIGGVEYNAGSFFELNPNASGVFLVGVYARSGLFDPSGTYYIRSNTTGNNPAYSINLLSTPTYATITLSIDGQLSWASVTGATYGYQYQVSYDGGPYGDILQSLTTLVNLSLTNHTSVKIRIRALGNGSNVITSEWIEREFIIS